MFDPPETLSGADSFELLLVALEGREAAVMAHTSQVGMVQQSLVRELAHDVYVKRRDERRSASPDLRLARIEGLLDETICELAVIRRDVRAMIEQREQLQEIEEKS